MKAAKLLILLSIILSGMFVKAQDNIELMLGSITYHPLDIDYLSRNYSNKLSQDGRLIANFLIGSTLLWEDASQYESLSFYGGQNSLGSPMAGFKVAQGAKVGNFYMGMFAGAYVQNDQEFTNLGIKPFRVVDINGTGVIPLGGIESSYKIPLVDDKYIKLNVNFSLSVVVMSFSYGLQF